YTRNRRTLVEALDESDRPVSIPELLGERRDLAQSSAYRNLAVLERAGVVRRIVTSDEFARYELAEDLTEHHHHLICSVCGADAPRRRTAPTARSRMGATARYPPRTGRRSRARGPTATPRGRAASPRGGSARVRARRRSSVIATAARPMRPPRCRARGTGRC